MTDEFLSMLMAAVVAYSKYYSGTYLKGMRKTINPHHNRYPDRDSNQAVTEYQSVFLFDINIYTVELFTVFVELFGD
jgi:hypothetical protein